MQMLQEIDGTNTQFKAERSMKCRAFIGEERAFTASVELTGRIVACNLDDSEYCFTAQQCGELADSLVTVMKAISKRASSGGRMGRLLNLDFCKIFYHLILSRSLSTRRDQLYGYDSDSDSMLVGASGSFRYPGTNDFYKLFVGFNDELNLPFLGIEGWVYTFSFDEAYWLIEQLCIGGYLLAQIEKPEEKPKKKGRNYQ